MISAIVSQVNRPSVVIDLESDGLTMSEVQSRLVAATGIPMDMQRLTTAGGLVCSSVDMPLSALCPVGNANSHERIIYLSLSMRMGGGKGGFGSELRKMGARLAARKATNFDSCRDLNGRRLKTVKRAKALANYMEGEEDRQQQKKDKIKKKIAKYNKEPLNKKHRFDDTAYFEDNERIQEDVRLAVQQAIQQEEVKDDVQTALADKTNDTGSPISSSSSSSSALDKGKGPAVSAFAMWDEDVGDISSSDDESNNDSNNNINKNQDSSNGTAIDSADKVVTNDKTTKFTTNKPEPSVKPEASTPTKRKRGKRQ